MPSRFSTGYRCINALRLRFHSTDFTCLFIVLDYLFRRVLGRLLLCFAYCLLSFIFFLVVTVVLPFEALHQPRISIAILAIWATYLFISVVYYYQKASTTSPGSPPQILQEPLCRHCHFYKPLGTHHCAICNMCVLKMDHHCVWINQCVGAKNHRYFFQFLSFVVLGCVTYVFGAYRTFYYNYWSARSNQGYCIRDELEFLPWFDELCRHDFVNPAIFFTYFLCAMVALLVFGLWYWNFVLISAGVTYIELLQNGITRSMFNVVLFPLSNERFSKNWKNFLGLGHGRTFLRHILLPSGHVSNMDCTGLLKDEDKEGDLMVQPSAVIVA